MSALSGRTAIHRPGLDNRRRRAILVFPILFILMVLLLAGIAVSIRSFLDRPLTALDVLLSDVDVAAAGA